MAVGMIMRLPGGTQEFYDSVLKELDWETAELPAGFISHYAGPTEDGWFVFDTWESEDDFNAFAEARLMPAFQRIRGEIPDQRPEFVPIHNETHAATPARV